MGRFLYMWECSFIRQHIDAIIYGTACWPNKQQQQQNTCKLYHRRCTTKHILLYRKVGCMFEGVRLCRYVFASNTCNTNADESTWTATNVRHYGLHFNHKLNHITGHDLTDVLGQIECDSLAAASGGRNKWQALSIYILNTHSLCKRPIFCVSA